MASNSSKSNLYIFPSSSLNHPQNLEQKHRSCPLIVSAILERDWNVEFLGFVEDGALDLLVELWLHQFPQNISPRSNCELQFQWYRKSSDPSRSAQASPTSIQWDLVSNYSDSHVPLALPRLIELLHLQKDH